MKTMMLSMFGIIFAMPALAGGTINPTAKEILAILEDPTVNARIGASKIDMIVRSGQSYDLGLEGGCVLGVSVTYIGLPVRDDRQSANDEIEVRVGQMNCI
jgi:hypothetical protein